MGNWTVPLEWEGEAAFIIGGGPSLRDFDFERLRGKGRVIAVNSAYVRAPWADVLFWADERWFEWNHADLHKHTGKYKISRRYPHKLTGHDIKVLTFLPSKFAYHSSQIGGWCGGSSAINLAYHFGARVVILLGFDMRAGNWHNYHLKPSDPRQHRDKFIPTIESMVPHLKQSRMVVLNTNPDSALRCFPFADIEELLAMDNLAKIEEQKYMRIWERPEYRKISPGMLEVERATMICEYKPGQSLIDFGSGPCRATKHFMDAGMHVLAIDFADNAREFEEVPFLKSCLWELSDAVPTVDHGYCCDVMEHIPTHKIDAVLSGIASRSRIGCYFRIATRPDKLGALIGTPLHLTVQSSEWWRRKIENHFRIVDVIEENGRDVILWARHSANIA